MDDAPIFRYRLSMEFDWRGRVILEKLAEGCIVREAAAAAGISKRAVGVERWIP